MNAPGAAALARRWTPDRLTALREQILEQARIVKGPHRFDTDWATTDDGLLDLRGVKAGRDGLQFRIPHAIPRGFPPRSRPAAVLRI